MEPRKRCFIKLSTVGVYSHGAFKVFIIVQHLFTIISSTMKTFNITTVFYQVECCLSEVRTPILRLLNPDM